MYVEPVPHSAKGLTTCVGVQYLPLEDTPEFSIFLQVTPFVRRGMIRADIPDIPVDPVRTAVVQ